MKDALLFFALLSCLALSGWIIYEKTSRIEPEGLLTSQIYIATSRNLDSIVVAMGTIKPQRGAEIKVGSRASGIVKKMFVKVGDVVSRGDTLGKIDRSEYEAIHKQWQAAMQSSDAGFEYSRLAVIRLRELYRKNFASEQEKDLAEKAQVIAEYEKQQAEANLKAARVRLDYTEVVAPVSGVVSSINIDQGETVAASFLAPTLLTIIDLERLELWAYVDEADVGRIKHGQKVEFFLNAYPGVGCEGKVELIRPKAEMTNSAVQFVCFIEITDDRGLPLKPEMTATINFDTNVIYNVLTVPIWSIKTENRRPYVNILKGNSMNKRWVRTGWKDNYFTEILEGLSEGDSVVYSNQSLIQNR